MTFDKLPQDAFSKLQIGAGVFLTTFDPSTGTLDTQNIFGATDGGCNFVATPSFKDLGEGIDNCPKNTKELKQIESWEVKMSGTLKTMSTNIAKSLLGSAVVDNSDPSKVTAKRYLSSEDFSDIWWVGDYNGGSGFIAIKLVNALSTGGFAIQSTNNDKGASAFEFTGHSSLESPDVVPFEMYIDSSIAQHG